MKKLLVLSFAAFGISSSIAEGDAAKGKEVYDTIGACAACHGPAGAGDGPAAAALNPKPRSFQGGDFLYDTDGDGKKGTDEDLKNILLKGSAAFGGSPLMVGRPDLEAKIPDLIAYIRSLKK